MRHLRALMLGVALIGLVVACVGYVLLNEIRTPAAATGSPIQIDIASGESTLTIAAKLNNEGIIRRPTVFSALVRARGLDGKLQAGRYLLSPTMTMSEVLIALQHSQMAEAELTIPEGLRLEEIAVIVGRTGVISSDEFLATVRDGARFKDQYFLLNSLPANASLEGYLFPDTYRIASTANVSDVIKLMLDRFVEQYGTLERDVQVPDVNVHQIVTMAAIVQREAVLADEMARISAVFWNRLKPENAAVVVGRLGSDPTVQYALGYSAAEETWWRKNLTIDDLRTASPYNTRENAGLPPGPIAAPGLAALRAAAQPDNAANYLFFVASCTKDGSHNFAVSFSEFQQYEAEWLSCQ